jgi:phage terminase large subunit-like protein
MKLAHDPVAFIEEVLHDPETGEPFRLYEQQRMFLRRAFELAPDGRLLYPELLFSAIKKSGKTGLAACILIYVVRVLGGRFAEGYCCANDLEQSQGRVFRAAARIIEASPLLAPDAKITASRIEFLSTCATIDALASDYAGAAGANPSIVVFDELWGYTSESAHRLWDEMVPPPTRKIACRLTVTYAGFEGDSDLLESLYKRGLAGEQIAPDLYAQPGMLMFWSHEPLAPWQTPEWKEQMRQQLRPNGFLRLIENRWVTTESTFVDMAWWDRCVDPDARPLVAAKELPVWIGVDASVKRDSTAIQAVAFDHASQKVRAVWHRIFQPSASEPLDFEATIERTLLDLGKRFRVRAVLYDPYQMQAVAQRLLRAGVPMREFPQSVPNLTEASTNLFELIKGGGLAAYPDADVRLAVQRCVALESTRGWRIAKEKASHKIDIVVALGMAALAAVRGGASFDPESFFDVCRANENLPRLLSTQADW